MRRILFVVNVDWFFLSHRLPLALEAKKRGYDVTIAAIETGKRQEIESHGFTFFPIPTSRAGTNIYKELNVLFFLWKLYRKIKPDILHHVGVKPVTYGSIIAKLQRLPKVVNALSGMGYLFINSDKNIFAHGMVMKFFKFGFNNRFLRFILQNHDDLAEIEQLNVLKPGQIFLIKGSGVDLEVFRYIPPIEAESIKVVLPARMLWDKGISEFVEAARILKNKHGAAIDCLLVGNVDEGNISTISEKQLTEWSAEGNVNWVGHKDNMVEVLASAHIVVLPSYREGLPKSLIEACAIGRPIVTTDVPGCREVVIHEKNGFLVPDRNAEDLAIAIDRLFSDTTLRYTMGIESRKLAENQFSIGSVIQKTFEVYNS